MGKPLTMKKELIRMPLAFAAVIIAGIAHAQITFSNQTVLLPSQTERSGNAIGVCDMNGDHKDDIVRALSNWQQCVEFQTTPNAMFTELAAPAGTIGHPWSMSVGDLNNDGFNDVAWGDGVGFMHMLHWNGTNYTPTNVTTLANTVQDFPQGCNFFDINNDGWLDAFMCNDNTTPDIFRGNGTPNGWTAAPGFIALGNYWGNYASIWTDINNDGYIDLMITHCSQSVTNPSSPGRIDQVFINNGNGTYTEDVTNWTGLRDGAQGWCTASGDIDNDGDMDLFVMNYDVNAHFWRNNGDGTFVDIMATAGIQSTTTFFGINATFHDFDNDGYVDLLIAGTQHFLYRNNGNETFTLVSPDPFPNGQHPATAIAVGDLNGDGKLDGYASYCDLFQTPSTYPDILWMNTTSNGNHYVTYDLVGGGVPGMTNRTGIGAIVKIYGAWGVQVRELRSGEGYGLQNTFAAHFGLGTNTTIDSAVVIWPSGIVDYPPLNPVDGHIVVNEGAFPNSTSTPSSYYHPFRMTFGPNPMGEQLTVNLYNTGAYGLENIVVEIFDVNGKLVYAKQPESNSFTIERNGMARGMYVFNVCAGGKSIAAKKLIVQ